jgi:hypothetical protein
LPAPRTPKKAVRWITMPLHQPMLFGETWLQHESEIEQRHESVQLQRVLDLSAGGDGAAEHRNLIARYIEVWKYPDARFELRVDGRVLRCRQHMVTSVPSIAAAPLRMACLAVDREA